jgi:pimeloyl-ACP methyl ester carboxylesterase
MRIYRILLFFLVLTGAQAQADVILLVHGLMGNSFSWEKSGINRELTMLGWPHAGTFEGSLYGPQLLVTGNSSTTNRAYTATLPYYLPVIMQADILKNITDILEQNHPDEKITLVGHSAGGVVARTLLVRHTSRNIKGLITIASPHVGTSRADTALDITDNHGPFNIIKNVIGGDDYDNLKHSRGLLYDIKYAKPGNMLYWLNSQPHPDIHYASIIRLQDDDGDKYVPAFSQDMNNVPALMGRSSVFITPTSHSLTARDALTITSIINHW